MYIREDKIRTMMMRSKALWGLGWITTFFWGACFVLSLMRKVDMQFAIATFFFVLTVPGIAMLWISDFLQNAALEARFFENIFSNDLDGRIDVHELLDVVGKNEKQLCNRLQRLKSHCMQGFSIYRTGGKTYIELESKTTKCICKNCGGEIEKKIYYKGVCPYCGSLDIFAQVISGDHLYSIQHVENASSESYFYITGDADIDMQKKELFMCMIHTSITILFIMFGFLGGGDVVKEENALSSLIMFVVLAIPFFFCMTKHYWNFRYIATARRFSRYAANITDPFISLSVIFVESIRNVYDIFVSKEKEYSDKQKLKAFREIQKRGYSRNCSLLQTEDGLMIGLKRDIKKSTCPMCGSSLAGTLRDQSICDYCGYIIKNAIGKI